MTSSKKIWPIMQGTCNPILKPKAISETQVAASNALYSAPLVAETNWLSSKWKCRFQHVTKPEKFSVQIIADWSGARVIVRSNSVWLKRLTTFLAGSADIELLPKLLQIALAEAVFSELVEQIESRGKRRVRIESIFIDKDALAEKNEFSHMNGLQWQAECDGLAYRGEIWLDCDGLVQAAELNRLKKSLRCAISNLAALPVSVRFAVGRTTLLLKE